MQDRLNELGLNYAVIKAGPHTQQNLHDDFGIVVKKTNVNTGRVRNVTGPADLHITLLAGKKEGERGEELYLQGHIFVEKVLKGDGSNPDEFDYKLLEDPRSRKHLLPGDTVTSSEEWFLTPNTHIVSSPAPELKLTNGGETGLEAASTNQPQIAVIQHRIIPLVILLSLCNPTILLSNRYTASSLQFTYK